MADIFVSYATEDRERIGPLVELLQREGWSVWWDREIHAGPRFDRIIEQAIEQAACIVVVWSRSSVQSDWVRTEANEGLERGILVPLQIDDVRPPLEFRRSQTADLIGFPENRAQLDVLLSGIRETLRSSDQTGAEADDPASVARDERIEEPSTWPRQVLVGGVAIAIVAIAVWVGWFFVRGEPSLEPIRSIAVLPLENLSDDGSREHFADGTTDLLIQDLGKISALDRVISRVSVMRYKGSLKAAPEIAAELGVDGLLTGTITPSADRVRISLQLYDAREDRDIWFERYERPLDDIFKLQATIARTVAQELELALSDDEVSALAASRTVDPASHDAFLQGRNYAFRGMYAEALPLLEQAIELDSSNADAYAEIARLKYIEVFGADSAREIYPQVQRYNDLALSIDPRNVHARATKALLTVLRHLSYQDGIDQFSELLRSHPSDTDLLRYYVFALQAVNRQDLALNLARRRVEIDPFDPQAHYQLGGIYQGLGELEAARDSYLAAESLGRPLPDQLAGVALMMRDEVELQHQLQRVEDAWGSDRMRMEVYGAIAAKRAGDEGQLRKIAEEHEERANHERVQDWFRESLFHRWVGDTSRAVAYWDQGIDSLQPVAIFGIHGTAIDRRDNPEFYSHPGYEAMLERIGLGRSALREIRVSPFSDAIARH